MATVTGRTGPLISFDQLEDSANNDDSNVIVGSYHSKSGSLAREFLSKQATGNSVAEELGIPANSDVALQAIAEFERSINAKLDGVEEDENEVDRGLGPNDHATSQISIQPSIPDDFVSDPADICTSHLNIAVFHHLNAHVNCSGTSRIIFGRGGG